ncbi:hypothetical protein IAQ61_004699 [Plenodomus lingam]|uniref:uncharacterized protein n=1 Tax=Leptosphaeria maculans TaxID=5022 RepID=UPI00332207A6|nr:hypothetical protein IAQ61_004699 [Plenodomus lingam]
MVLSWDHHGGDGALQTRESIYDCSSPNRSDARALASKIYTRLPLELRNRVYTYCVQGPYDDEVIIRRSLHSRNAFDFLVRESSGPHSYLWVEDPTASLISSERMTTATAREMLEAYYWTRVFKFSHRELDLLTAFLGTDVFGLGRLPVIYARRLHIQLRPFAHAQRSPKHDAKEQAKCRQAISALAAIQNARTEVVVQFDLARHLLDGASSDEQFSAEDAAFLLLLVRDLIALKEKGLRVEILFSGTWNEHPSTRIRSMSICSPEECMVRVTKAARYVRLGETP